MSDPLANYLHDHLAGSHFAIDLVESLRDQYAGEPLGEFAGALLVGLREDQETLQQVIVRVGKSPTDMKEVAGWLTEKLSRLKLRRDAGEGLGTFQALETLALGLLGKLALWRAVALIAGIDARVQGFNFEELMARAQEQHDGVEEHRLQIARTTLGRVSH